MPLAQADGDPPVPVKTGTPLMDSTRDLDQAFGAKQRLGLRLVRW